MASIKIPNNVTEIGSGAFYGCTRLASIKIPNSVTEIGSGAFKDCTNLKSINIPNSVTTLGYSAFENCVKLATVELPNTINKIAPYTFCNCLDLASIKLSSHMVDVGVNAFQGCILLDRVNIKGNIKDYTHKVKYLHEHIKQSVEKNILIQKDEVLMVVNDAVKARIIPSGENLEDEYLSYRAQLMSEIREKLRAMPRKLFVNSSGVVSITPRHYLANDFEVRTNMDSVSILSDFIAEGELLSNTNISSVILKPEDIKYNESDETFTFKVNGYTYTYLYDGNQRIEEVSVTQDEVIPNAEQELEKFREIFAKGIDDAIKEGTKPVDISKMNKKELIAYNKAAKLANTLRSFNPKDIEDIINKGFAAKEAGFLDIIEQVTGYEVTPEIKNVANVFTTLRTEYINSKNGKSNC